MFFRVPGNRASAHTALCLAAEACTELSHAAGTQVSSCSCPQPWEAIWAPKQDLRQAGEGSGSTKTMHCSKTYIPCSVEEENKKDKHKSREKSLSCFFSWVRGCHTGGN